MASINSLHGAIYMDPLRTEQTAINRQPAELSQQCAVYDTVSLNNTVPYTVRPLAILIRGVASYGNQWFSVGDGHSLFLNLYLYFHYNTLLTNNKHSAIKLLVYTIKERFKRDFDYESQANYEVILMFNS